MAIANAVSAAPEESQEENDSMVKTLHRWPLWQRASI
jgi:hypothetical protein